VNVGLRNNRRAACVSSRRIASIRRA
jgi:hypothetical protein